MATDDSRRNFIGRAFVGTSMGLWAIPNSAISKESAQDILDKEKISKGLHRLNYLLENWESETTVCNTSNDNPYIGCERTPMKVMDVSLSLSLGCIVGSPILSAVTTRHFAHPFVVWQFLGYKSMNDPLFKAEKTLRRLEALVPPDDEGAYMDAVDTWIEKADEGSGMAYISSWGESNPGGGKDRIAFFIERSKRDVVDCRDSLATVARILHIE